jgi:superfamily I DNA and RNA helicase
LATAHALGFGIYRDKYLVQYFDEPDLWYKIGYEAVSGENLPGKQVRLARRKDASPSFFQDLLDPADAVMCKVFGDKKAQAAWVAQNIKTNLTKDELEFSDILIILPDAYTSRTEASMIIEALRNEEINAHLAGVTSSRDELFIDSSIAISHIYRAKGNEAPMIYILNSQYGFEGPELIKRRNALFTAITRSRAWVRICGYGSAMNDLKAEIDKVIENDFKLEFQVPTQTELAKMRKIHRDMTRDEQDEVRKMEEALSRYVESVEKGDLGEDIISRSLRDKLRSILTD